MSVASASLAFIGGVIVIVFIGLYSAATPGAYIAGLLWIVPADRRALARELFGAIAATLQRWFLARIMSMTVVGVLTGVGLWLIGMPLFIALGILAAIFYFVPLCPTSVRSPRLSPPS